MARPVLRRLLGALLLAFGLLLAVGAHAQERGRVASDFTLRDINGQSVSLSDFRGQVVLINFWATWCGPCKVEMPHLQRLYEDRKDDGFVVLSISADEPRTASQVRPYVRRSGFTFPVLLDRESTVTSVYNPTKTLPYTLILDREQRIVKVHSGYNPGDEREFREVVERLLAAGEASE